MKDQILFGRGQERFSAPRHGSGPNKLGYSAVAVSESAGRAGFLSGRTLEGSADGRKFLSGLIRVSSH